MITRKPAPAIFAILALLTTSLPFSGNARAQQPSAPPATSLSFEERLAKLEAEVVSLRQENQQLRNQIGIVAARADSASSADASVAPGAADDATADAAEAAARKAAVVADASVAPQPKPAGRAPAPGISASGITPPASGRPAAAAAIPATALIRPGGGEQWISVGGFIMAQAEAGGAIDSRFAVGDTANDRFYLRRARIVLGGHFAEDFDFKISAEMAGSLSNTGNTAMRGQLADGFISWTKYSALNLTMGQFKTSYGHEFLSNDLTVYTIEHALVTDLLTLGRQIGAQASGTFLKNRFNYTLGIFNGNNVNTNANDNDEFLYAGRVTFAPVKTRIDPLGWDAVWNVGVNGYASRDTSCSAPGGEALFRRRTGWGVDTQLTIGPWALWFEYLNTEFARSPVSLAKINADGWFLQGAWNIVPKKWQAVARFDTFDPDTDIANNQTDTWTFGVNYLIKGDDLKLMLDYITSDPRFRTQDGGYKDEGRANRVLFRLQAVF